MGVTWADVAVIDRLADDVVLGEPLAAQFPDQFARVAADRALGGRDEQDAARGAVAQYYARGRRPLT